MKPRSNPLRAKTARLNRIIARASVLAVAVAAAGCEHDFTDRGPKVAGWSLVDPSQRHPIIVSQQPQTMELSVNAGSRGLTPVQRADLIAFADSARASDAGNSRLVISAPGGGSTDVAAMYAVSEIRQILSDNGFQDSSIAVETHSGGNRRTQAVRITYLRYIAEGPSCGNWPSNVANEPRNQAYENFGCTSQHNLAAMVANPADLLGPRTESDRPSERRDAVWDKYVKGESSATIKNEDEKITQTTQ